jgi:DNA polymerase gamma 1
MAPKWLNETSLNNLNDVYQLYCKKGSLEKHKRNIFVEGNMDDIRADVQNLMNYCANDVSATFEIFHQVFPLFR